MKRIARTFADSSFAGVFVVAPLAWTTLAIVHLPVAAEVTARYAVYAAILLAAWRLRAVAGSRLAPAAVPTRDRRFTLVALAVSAAVTVTGLRWLAFHPGVPVLLHDWSWPVSRDELRHLAGVTTADWNEAGFGAPKAFPTLYTLYAPASAVALLAGPHATLVAILVTCGCVAGTALALFLHRICGVARPAALVAAAAYVASPFLVDELGAGHLANVLAYGFLPAVALVAATSGPSVRAAVASGFALGLLVAISTAQIQYAYFDGVAVAFALATTRRPRRALLATCVVAALVVLAAHGQSFYHLAGIERHGTAAVDASPRAWFDLLSATTLSVLGQSGYIGAYADNARLLPGAWDASLLGALGWMLAGFALRFGGAGGAALAGLVLAGVVGATGAHGPFAAMKLNLAGIRAMTAFREAYNFQCLTTLGLAGCTAVGLAAARRSRAGGIVAVGAIAFATLAAFPFVSGKLRTQVHVWHEDDGYAAARTLVATEAPDDGRVAMLPLVQPIRQDGYAYGGTEIYGSGFAGAPVVAEWRPEAELATADLLLRGPDPGAGVRLLGRLGVRRMMLRYDLVSDLPHYWFPRTFSPDWSTRDYYRNLERSAELRERARSARVVTYDVRSYAPRLAFARPVRTCSGISPLAVLARENAVDEPCRGALEGDDAIRRVALDSSAESYDPSQAWIFSRNVFSLGTAFAEHGDTGLATVGPTLLERRFNATPGDRLAIDCLARGSLEYSLNGSPFAALPCASDPNGIPSRVVSNETLRAQNRLWIQNGGRPALVAAISTGRAFPLVSRTAYVPLGDTAPGGGRIAYVRANAGRLDGTIDAQRAMPVVLSDAFDDRWHLRLNPGPALGSERANVDENVFMVPAGHHRFALTFDLSATDRALGAIQFAAWPISLTGWLVFAARGFMRPSPGW